MQTTVVEYKDAGCSVTVYDLYDTYHNTAPIDDQEDQEEEFGALATSIKPRRISTGTSTLHSSTSAGTQTNALQSETFSSGSNLITPQGSGSPPPKPTGLKTHDTSEAQMERLCKLDSMVDNLFVMERAVVQNAYHIKHCQYRGLKDLYLMPQTDGGMFERSSSLNMGPSVSRLWAYECALTRGLAVTCMTWNPADQDILAVGYSQNAFAATGKGVILYLMGFVNALPH